MEEAKNLVTGLRSLPFPGSLLCTVSVAAGCLFWDWVAAACPGDMLSSSTVLCALVYALPQG